MLPRQAAQRRTVGNPSSLHWGFLPRRLNETLLLLEYILLEGRGNTFLLLVCQDTLWRKQPGSEVRKSYTLCSADLGTIHSALGHMQKDAQEGSGISLIGPPFFLTKQQRLEKVGQVAKVVLGLRKLMDILAREPIMVDSGQHEPIYDKTRTYADVQNEIATRLANLPKFTARVKITVDGKPVEHTVKTLSPERGLRAIALQDRKDRIRANNRTDGYTRKRDEVEEEIRNRQNPPQAPPDTPT
jgi:hypothetical protein